jgi:hypothetical protein
MNKGISDSDKCCVQKEPRWVWNLRDVMEFAWGAILNGIQANSWISATSWITELCMGAGKGRR